MLAGFAIEGFVLSAILVHMVPLTATVGLGTAGVFVASLFGPAQVASRFINMLFGHNLRQSWLAPLATALLAAGLLALLVSAPSVAGAALFTILFGLGSGLMSIVGGTLPLELFGRDGYGAHVGWVTAARQFSAAFAPFGLTVLMGRLGGVPDARSYGGDWRVGNCHVRIHRRFAEQAGHADRQRNADSEERPMR